MVAQATVPAPTPGVSGLILPPEWWNCLRAAATSLKARQRAGIPGDRSDRDHRRDAHAGRARRARQFARRRDPGARHARAGHRGAHRDRSGVLRRGGALRRVPSGGAAEMDQPADIPRRSSIATAVVDPKDFIGAQLTGRIASDPIAMARLVAAASSTRRPFPALAPRPAGRSRARPAAARQRDRPRAHQPGRAVQRARRPARGDGLARHLVAAWSAWARWWRGAPTTCRARPRRSAC